MNSTKPNLDAIKRVALMLLTMPIKQIKGIAPELAVIHPFAASAIHAVKVDGGQLAVQNILADEDSYNCWIQMMTELINRQKSANALMGLVNKPYRLLFLKLIRPFLDSVQFSQLLVFAWIQSENGNNDPNVGISEIVRWFREGNKEFIMDQEERAVYDGLPEAVTLYRGVGINRVPRGISWTDNYDTAKWFAHRFDTPTKQGYIQEVTVKKNLVLAYLNSRGEKEMILDITKVPRSAVKICDQ